MEEILEFVEIFSRNCWWKHTSDRDSSCLAYVREVV